MSEADRLAEKLESGGAVVGIIGLGYVGLPLALSCTKSGFSVLGFDIDKSKEDRLNRGESYIHHIDSSQIVAAQKSGRFTASSDFSRLGEADVLVICVPTPLAPDHQPDLSFVESTAAQIKTRLRRGQLIILESTTYPGTTEDLLRSLLDACGLECGREYFLAFSPEREDPGNVDFSISSIPKIVAGANEVSGDLAEAFYERVTGTIVRVSNCRTAEAAKLTENIFRAVNIALVNELKIIFDKMDIDIWEVLDAASTKPFGFMRFDPGPGWGGHCIPIDPFYLSWKARQMGIESRFIERAGEVNIGISDFVMDKLETALVKAGKSLAEARVLILGLAYKRNVSDTRESPSFVLIDRLLHAGTTVCYHDPYLPVAPKVRSWPDLPAMACEPLTPETVSACDAVLLVTDHSGVDYELVAENAQLIVDTRGVYRGSRPNLVRA